MNAFLRSCIVPLLALSAASSVLLAEPPLGVLPVDPVALVKGEEIPGEATLFVDHHLFRYVFANEANRAEFLARPETYEIQLGGACGRMGLLSGEGDPARYAVHEGRIYIFASDPCRETFRKDPAAVLDRIDAPPIADEEDARRGRELLDRALESAGGAERIDRIASVRVVAEKRVEHQGKMHTQTSALTLGFPAHVRRDETWDDSRWTHVETPEGGWYESTSQPGYDLPPASRDAMRRVLHHRHPISILRGRNEPGFIAAYAGPRVLEHAGKTFRLEMVRVWFDGSGATLGIEPASGTIRTISFLGRASRVGEVEQVCIEHQTVDGVVLPRVIDVRFEGKPVESQRIEYTTMLVDDQASMDLFRRRQG